MEKQKKTLKINLKTMILLVSIITILLIVSIIFISNYLQKNKSDSEKIVSETENIDFSKNKKYDTIEYIGEDGTLGVTIYKEDKKEFELVNLNGKTICNFEGFEYYKNVNDYILICNNDLGISKLIDINGNIILEDTYQNYPKIIYPEIICIGDTKQAKFIAFKQNGKFKIVNIETKEILSNSEYEDIVDSITNGLIKVKQNDKWGYINEKGNIIIDLEYDGLSYNITEDIIIAEKDGKIGFLDKEENIIVNFEYEDMGIFSEGLISAKKDGKIGFLDKVGNIIIDFQYEYPDDFYEKMPFFSEEITLVFENELGKFIDKSGNKAMDAETEIDIVDRYFSNGVLVAEKNGKQGVLNKDGKIIVDFIYEEIHNIGQFNLLSAILNGKNGFIDFNGNIIIDFEFDSILSLDQNYDNIIDEYLIVSKNEKYGCIDKFGKTLIECNYEYLISNLYFNSNLIIAKNDINKFGLIDMYGNTIVDFKYDEFNFPLDSKMNNILGFYRNVDVWDILDINGNKIGEYKCKSE